MAHDITIDLDDVEIGPGERVRTTVNVRRADGTVVSTSRRGAAQVVRDGDELSLGILASAHVTAAGGGTTYADEVLADSPEVYYRLGDTSGLWQDSSGNGRHTTDHFDDGGTDPVTRHTTGLITSGDDGCVEFNRNEDQFIQTDDAAWMDMATVTMECWVATSYTSDSQAFFGRWRSASDASYGMDVQSTGRTRFYVWTSAGYKQADYDSVDIRDGDPHHVVGTYDGSTLRLYVDGSEVATASHSGNIVAHDEPLILGARAVELFGAGNGCLSGKLDEVALYSGALSATRVLAHYNAGTA